MIARRFYGRDEVYAVHRFFKSLIFELSFKVLRFAQDRDVINACYNQINSFEGKNSFIRPIVRVRMSKEAGL